MSVSYVVDIASLILRGPHATMIVGAASGWSQSTLNTREGNPVHRTLFNMACLVLTVQAAGQVFQRLGGTATTDLGTIDRPGGRHGADLLLREHRADCDRDRADHQPERLESLEDRLRLERRQLLPRRGRRRRGGGGDRERRDRADTAPRGGAALPDLQGLPCRRRNRGTPGRDPGSGARRDLHDGSTPEHPGVQPGGRGDVRPQEDEHPRPARRHAAAGARAAGASIGDRAVRGRRARTAGRAPARIARAACRRLGVPSGADRGPRARRHAKRNRPVSSATSPSGGCSRSSSANRRSSRPSAAWPAASRTISTIS